MGDRIFQKLADTAALQASPVLVFAADALVAGGVQTLGTVRGEDPAGNIRGAAAAIGRAASPRYRTRPEFLQLVREIVADGSVDGVLMTPADAEVLALHEGLFEASPVTPIVRMNAETSLWNPRHGAYRSQPSLPFPTIPPEDAPTWCDRARTAECGGCRSVADTVLACRVPIGLYSITLNNDVHQDEHTLNAYLRFAQAVGRQPGFSHFLEVFLPNVRRHGMTDEQCGAYVADSIVRTMSWLRVRQRPLLIKTEYTTPQVWRELCAFDPTLVVGALGGPRRGPRQTLQLAADVVANGGRALIFGRAIFEEEDPVGMARALRATLDDKIRGHIPI